MMNVKLVACVAAVGVMLSAACAWGQKYTYSGPSTSTYNAPANATAPATTAPAAAALKPEEVEQLVAPIALYPDSLLAQVLMASTYPLEIVQADRAVKADPKLGDSPEKLNKQTWDPSVKSLTDFPQVLTMLSEKLDWTVKLGDAFIADQKSVMDAVQRLRNKAYAQGNLKSGNEQKVTVQPTTMPVAGAPSQTIVVESTSPSVVYVPTYNPTVVYGAWPYPSYPPYYYYPPSFNPAGAALIGFGVGVAVGAAWGHAWGGCNWGYGEVDVDIDKNVNFNNNINRDQYKAERDARQTERQGSRDTRQGNRQANGSRANSFQHDPSHRQGVAYRDQATNDRFRGSGSSQVSAQARDAYRGRSNTGSGNFGSGANSYRGNAAAGRTGSSGFQGAPVSNRGSTSGTRSSGFSGAGSSGSSARAASNRGQTSRSSSAGRSYSGSGGGGGGYSGGGRSMGGARGGGGRGGGRR